MNAGQAVRIRRYPTLTGTLLSGEYRRYFPATDDTPAYTPLEARVDVRWDAQHGTPERTTIIADRLEVVVHA